MGLRHEAEVLGAPSTSLKARIACLALQGPAASPTWTEARERGSGTRKLSLHPQHNLEESRYSARWRPWHMEPQTPAERSLSSLCKVVFVFCRLSHFCSVYGLARVRWERTEASRRNWQWGRTSAGETAWETRASSFTHRMCPLTTSSPCCLRTSKSPGWAGALLTSSLALWEEMENAGEWDCPVGTSLIKGLLLTGSIP